MFWRFGGYANISTIDAILDKPDFTLEELLDEGDFMPQLKQHNSKLMEYLREDKALNELLDCVVAPKHEPFETPEESAAADDDAKGRSRLVPFSRPRASSRADEDDGDEHEKRRNRYALLACDVLCSEHWSICEALPENHHCISRFWLFLSRPAPLDPLQASYFTKVNELLFEKKTEDMMLLFQTLPDVVPDLLRHVECPMIMDLLLKIIAMDRAEGGHGIVEWLYSKDIIPGLLSCLDPSNSWVVQTAAGDFIKAIITISANASQNEQQCIGPNELTRQLVSKPCVERLIGYMLGGGNPLTVGVGIVIEVIRKNNSDYDPDVDSETNTVPSGRDPIYLGTLLRLFADNVPNFMNLIMNGPSRRHGLASTFGEKLEPLGFDRFKTCELMAELLHCSNMGLLNEAGSERLIASRDAQRQRLRAEGKLWPQKEEDRSADDLTMRMPQTSPDEARRLEITNADDDFEEVEPSREMSEDTSHEFVKAENDMAAAPPASFLERDDDDFMDEPLVSPQPPFFGVQVRQEALDDPDLIVAPLSPSKIKPPRIIETDASEAPSPEPDKGDADEARGSPAPEATPEATFEAKPEVPTVSTSDTGLKAQAGSAGYDGLSPHPEDTPPPLFSAPDVVRSPQGEADGPAEPQDGPQAEADAEAMTAEAANPEASLEEERTVDESKEEVSTSEAVVGDFLKMQFVDYDVVPAILSFFFAYPWNNFLHNVVYDVVQQVFNGPMDRGFNPTLAVSLFKAADITTAIIKGQHASDVSQAQTKTRMGYMGHLTLIAEEVVKFTERHPPELLSEMVLDKVMSQDWVNYVEGALAETRERDNAILGGVRPDMAMGPRGSIGGNGLAGVGLANIGGGVGPASNALAEAGLNGGVEPVDGGGGGSGGGGGNGANSLGPFAISGGTLMSGFGSSSDEEDEEGEGDDEDVNSEVSGDSSEERSGVDDDDDDDVVMTSPLGAVKLHDPNPVEEDEPMVL
ncbi:SIT4 phosphatase-associated protein [Ophiocordyceps camponoti-floridani]|uniref:SIT4 phosphatase-associated protein n=1 Tax=Ophiocordyceps camponoti-floridani TaxID=2030778 RepID=A0A8H4VGM8_9HYPO|nr:SIT4 phosphatase-associated protein [Ophiocordyceps camponoti-floridani]